MTKTATRCCQPHALFCIAVYELDIIIAEAVFITWYFTVRRKMKYRCIRIHHQQSIGGAHPYITRCIEGHMPDLVENLPGIIRKGRTALDKLQRITMSLHQKQSMIERTDPQP